MSARYFCDKCGRESDTCLEFNRFKLEDKYYDICGDCVSAWLFETAPRKEKKTKEKK